MEVKVQSFAAVVRTPMFNIELSARIVLKNMSARKVRQTVKYDYSRLQKAPLCWFCSEIFCSRRTVSCQKDMVLA